MPSAMPLSHMQDIKGRRQLLGLGGGGMGAAEVVVGEGEEEAGRQAVALSAAEARWLQGTQYDAMFGLP